MQPGTVRGGAVGGFMLAMFGGVLLVGTIAGVNLWAFIWPYFITIPGLLCLAGATRRDAAGAAQAALGSMVAVTGMLLFYQNLLGDFRSWAYAWTLVCPTAIGGGPLIHGRLNRQGRYLSLGMRLGGGGLALFLLLAVCFEVGVFDRGALVRFGGPVVLIVAGSILTVVSLLRRTDHQVTDSR